MNDTDTKQFYRDQTWKLLFEKLESIESKQAEQGRSLASISSKVNYMYGWAMGAGAIFTIVFEFVKNKFFKT